MMMIMQQAWLQTFASIEIRFFEPNGPFFHFFRSIRILASSQQQQRRTNSALLGYTGEPYLISLSSCFSAACFDVRISPLSTLFLNLYLAAGGQ